MAGVWSHSSPGMSSIHSWVIWNAALLTGTSIRPNSATAVAIADRQCAGPARSPGSSATLRPASSTHRWVSCASSCS
ncbi:hypothetical protein FHX46_003295 [Amycolatopsis viridis]|uniref:Uncharacterized protein n=1 Tax=Amycolatopsis viridis TaxID=185678 RepID=A0ABX0SZL7_9PSEU|nr:hypothetical protein [Amycolatopsis viridis]